MGPVELVRAAGDIVENALNIRLPRTYVTDAISADPARRSFSYLRGLARIHYRHFENREGFARRYALREEMNVEHSQFASAVFMNLSRAQGVCMPVPGGVTIWLRPELDIASMTATALHEQFHNGIYTRAAPGIERARTLVGIDYVPALEQACEDAVDLLTQRHLPALFRAIGIDPRDIVMDEIFDGRLHESEPTRAIPDLALVKRLIEACK